VYRRLNGTGGRGTDAFFRAVTEFGSIWCSAGAAAVMARSGRRREAADALGAAMAMWLVGQGLKKLFPRARPYHALEEFRLMIGQPRGTSWPSSHPAVLLAFLTVAARDLDLPPPASAGAVALAGAVGASRVYLGVHYPADVASGLLLGRGVGDLWNATVSPRILGRLPAVEPPPSPLRIDTVTET
jgi:membrane-associated phospholipid phosphatase